jgi:N-acetylglucosaminyl-diphospho-decaprenol L-rhamnosyltransferase
MELSIICVNWNSVDCLRECIASIYEHTAVVRYEIIVVDNASPLGGVEALESEFPGIKLIKSAKNLGFAGANNVGCHASAGEYVLLLNPDTKLIAPSIDIMMGYIKTLPDAGILGCKLLNSDYSVQLSSIQKFPNILNQAIDAEYLRLRWPHCPLWAIAPLFSDDVKLIRVDVIPGACMLLRKAVFEQVGMYSEDYFMYAEDLDLNYKLKRAGYSNYYVGETAIIHHGGRSSSHQKISHWATIRKCDAMLRLFTKTRGEAYGVAYRAAMGCVALGRLAILSLSSPFGATIWDGKSRQFSSEKWKAVLSWALGRQSLALGQH